MPSRRSSRATSVDDGSVLKSIDLNSLKNIFFPSASPQRIRRINSPDQIIIKFSSDRCANRSPGTRNKNKMPKQQKYKTREPQSGGSQLSSSSKTKRPAKKFNYSSKKGVSKKTSRPKMLRPSACSAQVFWGSPSAVGLRGPSTKVVQDKTWGLSFCHYSPVLTDFSIKAGSKRMILANLGSSASTSSPTKTTRTTEDQLVRKYR